MAGDGRYETSRKFWLEFFQMYKEHPCMWDITCKEYTDKIYRDLAYNTLLEKYWELEPFATLDSLKRKIRTLRSGVLREYKKIEDARLIHSVYIPKLWYYDPLKFITPELESINDEIQPDWESDSKSPCSDRDFEQLIDSNLQIPRESSPTYSQAQPGYEGLPVISAVSTITDSEDLSTPSTSRGLAQNCIVQISEDGSEVAEDDCSTFAAHIKTRMRKFDPTQKMIAQKLISDIMFMADTKQLHMTSSIFNSQSPPSHFVSGFPPNEIPLRIPAPRDSRNRGPTVKLAYVIDSDGDDQPATAKRRI